MNDRDAIGVIRASLPVRALEAAGRWIHRHSPASAFIALAARASREASNRIGVVLLAATVTHVAMMLAARPTGWFWMILPSMVAIVAAFLLLRPRDSIER